MSGGGNISASQIGDDVNFVKVETTAHELFHGVQHEFGQGGPSVFNEVEAGVFGSGIAENWGANGAGSGSWTGMGTESPQGLVYQKAFDMLLKNGFSRPAMIDAVNNFKLGSQVNITGRYNKFPAISNPQVTSILDKFHPRIR